MEHLSYIDEHAVRVDAPRWRVWETLQRYASAMLRSTERSPVTLLLGAEPRAGFAVTDADAPTTLELTGRHRFSKYRLVFELADAEGGATQLRARTYAEFPGWRGRIYRAVVTGTRGHVLATMYLLRSVQRRAVAAS